MSPPPSDMQAALISILDDAWPEGAAILRDYCRVEDLRDKQGRPQPGDTCTWVGLPPEDLSAPRVVRILSRSGTRITVAVTDHADVSTLQSYELASWWDGHRAPDWIYDSHKGALRIFRVFSDRLGDPMQRAVSTVVAESAADAQQLVSGTDQQLRVRHVVALQRGLAAHEVFHAEPDIQAAATVLEGS